MEGKGKGRMVEEDEADEEKEGMDGRVHLGLQLLVEVIEHDAEFRSEWRVLTWKHERLGEHRGRCPEDGGYKSGSLG